MSDGASGAELPGIRRVEEIMGMPIVADVRDEGVDDALVERVFDWLRFVDATFSTYKADSEVSRLNRDELPLRDCHPDVRFVVARCRELRDETGGYFDAEAVVPGKIDPSGLVKGWSVDCAAAILDEAGLGNYALNAGGDIRLRGDALPERRWRIGIQHPRRRDSIAAVVEADDLAVATSGAYVRGRARHRPAHRQAAHRSALGHDRRARPGDGRRVRDRGLRDGRGRARVDARARAVRGDDDPRRRPRALDTGLSPPDYDAVSACGAELPPILSTEGPTPRCLWAYMRWSARRSASATV